MNISLILTLNDLKHRAMISTVKDLPLPPAGKTGWPWTEETQDSLYPVPEDYNWPRISIVTPSYNQCLYLEEALRSVYLQNYPNMEHIVIDGGSTDASIEIIETYRDYMDYWVSESDCGQSDALNKGLERVSGDVIGWLNSDDTYEPGTFYEVAMAFNNPDVDIVMCDRFGFMDSDSVIYKYKENSYQNHEKLVRYWETGGMTIHQPCVFFRHSVLKKAGKYLDNTLHYVMDYDLWLRLSMISPVHVVPGHWANYRIHATSKSGKGFNKFKPEWRKVSKRYWGARWSRSWWGHTFSLLQHNLKRLIKKIKPSCARISL